MQRCAPYSAAIGRAVSTRSARWCAAESMLRLGHKRQFLVARGGEHRQGYLAHFEFALRDVRA